MKEQKKVDKARETRVLFCSHISDREERISSREISSSAKSQAPQMLLYEDQEGAASQDQRPWDSSAAPAPSLTNLLQASVPKQRFQGKSESKTFTSFLRDK